MSFQINSLDLILSKLTIDSGGIVRAENRRYPQLLALLLCLLLASATAVRAADKAPVNVYFFTGGPIDIFSHDTCRKIKNKTQQYGRELQTSVHFERHWFTHWRKVMKEVVACHGRNKIVLIGHSWGAASAVQCAKALAEKNQKVDLLVTIDTIPVPGLSSPRKIPSNVVVNYNFYQTSDMFAHACRTNRRDGEGDDHGIYNVKVAVGPTYSPHMQIDNKIHPILSCQIKMLMMNQLDRLTLPNELDRKQLVDGAAVLESRLTTQ